jgi:hypothetical protein
MSASDELGNAPSPEVLGIRIQGPLVDDEREAEAKFRELEVQIAAIIAANHEQLLKEMTSKKQYEGTKTGFEKSLESQAQEFAAVRNLFNGLGILCQSDVH